MIEWSLSATSGMCGADIDEDFIIDLKKEQLEDLLVKTSDLKNRLLQELETRGYTYG